MHILDKLKDLRACLSSERCRIVWACIFCLFLCSIFVTDNVRMHRNFYYLLVIPLFALQAQGSFFTSLFRSPVFLAALAYLIYLWISLFWAPDTAPYTFYNEARTLVLMLIFLAITAYYAHTVGHFTQLLSRCFCIIVGPAAIISLVWFYSAHSFSNWGDFDSRAVGIGVFTYPLDSAVAYGFVAVFLIFSLFALRRDGALFSWFSGISLAAILAFIAMTQTRGVILSIAILIVLGMAWQRSKRLVLVFIALGAATLGIVLLTLYHPGGMIGEERGVSVRLEIWQAALDVARERIWFGFGLNEHQTLFLSAHPGYRGLGYQGVAHSIYLENLIFGGLVGTFLLLLMLGLALRRAFSEFFRSGDFLLPAIILFPMLSGITTGYLTLSKIAPEWIQFWLPIGLIIGTEVQRHNSPSSVEQVGGMPDMRPDAGGTL